jgi:hypothetical protein
MQNPENLQTITHVTIPISRKRYLDTTGRVGEIACKILVCIAILTEPYFQLI